MPHHPKAWADLTKTGGPDAGRLLARNIESSLDHPDNQTYVDPAREIRMQRGQKVAIIRCPQIEQVLLPPEPKTNDEAWVKNGIQLPPDGIVGMERTHIVVVRGAACKINGQEEFPMNAQRGGMFFFNGSQWESFF